MKLKFRRLRADEIDARISQVKDWGLILLLYKDARVDQNLLDETVGAGNWQREHQLIGDRLYCTVSIWDEEKKMFISKQDVGTESKTEAEKGQASDSFKRACFNWGIGRELYTAPNITVKAADDIDKWTKFVVRSIGYDDDGNINKLIIAHAKNGRIVYQYNQVSRSSMLQAISKQYPEGSKNLSALLNTFNVSSLDEATDSQLQAVYNKITNSRKVIDGENARENLINENEALNG